MTIGHNSSAILKSVTERLNRLMDHKEEISADINEVLKEAKSNGLEPKLIRKALKVARMDDKAKAKAQQEQDTLELYLNDIGILADTPLGRAGAERL